MAEIVMEQVSSSNIAAVGYDADEQELRVQFKDGSTYSYEGVPQPVYDGLMSSESVGKTFFSTVKGRYNTTRI